MHLLIEKTVKSASEFLQNFFIHDYSRKSYLHRVNPAVKIVGTTVLIFISITTFDLKKILLVVFSVILLAFNSGLNLKELVKRSYIFALFSLIIVLPASAYSRDYHYSIIFPLRVLSSIISLQLLIMTTKFNEMIYGLRALRIPPAISEVLWITYRYTITMFRDLFSIMLAREARRLSKSNHTEILKKGGEMLGLYFLRSYEKAEKIELAMKIRGKSSGSYEKYIFGHFYILYLIGVVIWWLII